jgi:hypothetical protein
VAASVCRLLVTPMNITHEPTLPASLRRAWPIADYR